MNLKVSSVAAYSRGVSPFAGIPIPGIGTVVLLRQHLQAALNTQPTRIVYNQDTRVLTLRSPRAEWRLNDLLGQSKIQRWQILQKQAAWAAGRRSAALKRQQNALLGKAGIYSRRLHEAVKKLTKRRDKIYATRPVSPLFPRQYRDAGDYTRREVAAWVAQKPLRRALAKLAGRKLTHGEPTTWAEFYRAVETITGKPVDESQTYGRVHARKHFRHGLDDYPNRVAYLKNLPRYLILVEKPWDRRTFDPYKKEQYGEQLNALEWHAQARREYCAALRERNALDSQIQAHLGEIASATGLAQ